MGSSKRHSTSIGTPGFLSQFNRYQHDVVDRPVIIQYPNPTGNPLADHQKQREEVQHCRMRQMEDANYVDSMEHKMMEQQQVIEALQAQNQLLSLQLRQHQDYISMVQTQNSALLTAYNA